MSCLYSSPEVTSLEVTDREITNLGLSSSSSSRLIRRTSRAPNRNEVQFHTDVARRAQQRRVPQQPRRYRRLHRIIQPAKTSTGFSREFSSAISGFRSLCGRKQRSSLKPSRSIDLRFGTFHSGRALALRTLASTRNIPSGYLRGQQPWTDVVGGT